MSIIQWNLRSFRVQRDDLRHLISILHPAVICLQETRLSVPPVPLPGYEFLSSPFSLPVTAILVRSSIPFVQLSISTSVPCTVARVFLGRWLTIVCVYFSPSIIIDFSAFSTLLSSLPSPLLVLGDFNCRNPLWGDSLLNPRGRFLEDFILTRDLFILNSGAPTHFDARTHSFSCIDLSLCSPSLALDFHWSVQRDFLSSDHFPILLLLTSYSPIPRPPRWCFDRADWPTFTSLTTSLFPPPTSSVEVLLDIFVTTVLAAAQVAIPLSTRPFMAKCVPWWTPACTKALRQKRARWKSYRRKMHTCDRQHHLILFKRASAVFRRVVKDAKSESWRSYVSSINSFTPVPAVWRRIRKLSNKHLPSPSPVLQLNNESIADPVQVATALGSHFSEISRGIHLSAAFRSHKVQAECVPVQFALSADEPYNAPFSTHELYDVLQTCKNTSEGLDGIHYRMLKHLSSEAVSFLLALFNSIWNQGVFPPSWKVALIIPFLKPSKSGQSPNDYRPIALTSCLCKVLERLVNYRFMWVLESKNLLSPLQYGFRKARSTLDPLVKLETFIRSSFACRRSVLAVFFDLEKAYDTTWKHNILLTLQSFGISGNMGVFLTAFLADRSFLVRVQNSVSDPFPQYEGVPQGCVLSTTLFLIAINGIVESLPPGVRSSLYVDDFAIYAADTDIHALCSLIQSAISSASSWATRHGFRFSTSKSCAVLFTRRRLIPRPPLSLYGSLLPYQPSAKFLGLLFDSRLTWDDHVSALRVSALQRLRLLQTLSHVSWGADRHTLLHLHMALVLSKLDYGCQIYSSASATTLRKLDPVHHLGLRLALGAFRSSPVESLYVESGLPSLYRRRALLSLRYFARLHQFPSPSVLQLSDSVTAYYTSHSRLPAPYSFRMCSLLASSPFPIANILPFRTSLFPPWFLPCPAVCSSILPCSKSSSSPAALRSTFLEHLDVHSSTVHVYTDGSKSPSGTSFAVLFPDRSYQYSLPTVASVLTTELHALLTAVRHIATSPQSSFVLFSDSLSALLMLQKASCCHPIVLQILEWLFRISVRKKSVTFCWVPSHVGVSRNEQVDVLARAATTFPCLPFNSLPASDFFPVFSSFLRHRWQCCWSTVVGNKLRSVKPFVSPWSFPCHRTRRWETALARLRIGHTRLTHGYLMSGDPPPVCTHCHVLLSIHHILLVCPLFARLRSQYFPFLTRLRRPLSLSDLLSESPHFSIVRLMTFLHNLRILPDL